MPEISVIVPVYKVEKYLRHCVDSILAQTFTDFDLILVDDGSPDNCPAICDDYAIKDRRVHVIHQQNGGLSVARNAGIDWAFANSDSQWITFVDSDDWVHRNYLKYMKETIDQTKSLICVCEIWRTDGQDIPDDDIFTCKCITADEFYCDSASEKVSPAAAWGKLYKKSLFKNLRFPQGKLHEDEFTTYIAVYQAEVIGMCGVRLYAYYSNPSGIMHAKWSPRRLDAIEAYEKQMNFAQKRNNNRLFSRILQLYAVNLAIQCIQINKMDLPERQQANCYFKVIRKKLRMALRQGKQYGLFPLNDPSNSWIYYVAFPVKMACIDRLKRILRANNE